MKLNLILGLLVLCLCPAASMAQEKMRLWPDAPPEFPTSDEQERDFTKPTDRLIAGRKIIKLGHVNQPEIHMSLPSKVSGPVPCVVICPGGGFSILAWDLEGTEVAEWLNENGIAAAVLKYRVPTRDFDPKWKAPVQDAQRAIRLVRFHAKENKIDPDRVAVLGFSAGGHTAARAALMSSVQYPRVDEVDDQPHLPNATILIYPAYLYDKETDGLPAGMTVGEKSPPMFLVHAYDDPISVEGSLELALALKRAKVPFDLHVYESGGHGYGMRPVADKPVTRWPDRCEEWLTRLGWIAADAQSP